MFPQLQPEQQREVAERLTLFFGTSAHAEEPAGALPALR